MYYVALLKSNEKETPKHIVTAHREYLKDMSEKGKVIMAGKLENANGLIIFDVDSVEEYERLINLDPFISGNYRKVEALELNIAVKHF